MENSTLIGTVLDSNPTTQYWNDGEKFYSIPMSFNGTELKVLYSEFHKFEFTEGRYAVKGSLVSDCSGGVPKCYFYANYIEKVSDDTAETNTVTEFGYVNKVRPLKTVKGYHDQLPITLVSRWIFGGHSLTYLVLRDKLARKYQQIEKGTGVQVTGRLETYRNVVEIVVDDITIKKVERR